MPEKITLGELKEIFRKKDYNALPDPQKDFVWIFHPYLNQDRSPSPKFRGSIRASSISESNRSKSLDSMQKFNYLPEHTIMVKEQVKMEKSLGRIRDLIELISFNHLSEASDFSWISAGKLGRHKIEAYKDFNLQIAAYKEIQTQRDQIRFKLQYLMKENSPLLTENDIYTNFYLMVLNEIKTHGRDKICKLVNNALDTYVNQILHDKIEEVSVEEGLTPLPKVSKRSFVISKKTMSLDKKHRNTSKSRIHENK